MGLPRACWEGSECYIQSPIVEHNSRLKGKLAHQNRIDIS